MQEIFQKAAKLDREADLRRSGVLSAASFDDYSSLRAFLPAKDLRPFISHYWIVRWDIPSGIVYQPTEVLCEPAVNIFFLDDEAFLYGLTTQTFDYEAKGHGVMAGVTFKPGGFYPFWGKDMTLLPASKSPLGLIFPEATNEFSNQLCALDDAKAIATKIEDVIKQKQVYESPHLKTIGGILQAVNFDQRLRSVQEVSRYFRIPERTLQLLFQREVGISLMWVIMRARMLEAITEAYKQPKPDWVRIAVDLGYSSQGHFISDFKRASGQTPATFRKQAF